MITVYVYGKCTTCQKALRFLIHNHILFTRKEIVETPPSMAELQQMLIYVKGDVRKLFNTSGMVYRELQLSAKLSSMSESEALKLLAGNGMLVKRPFLLGNGIGLVGFREEQWEKAFLG